MGTSSSSTPPDLQSAAACTPTTTAATASSTHTLTSAAANHTITTTTTTNTDSRHFISPPRRPQREPTRPLTSSIDPPQPRHYRHHSAPYYKTTQHDPPRGILYPVPSSSSSSGRRGGGFVPKPLRPQLSDHQTVTVANPGLAGFPPRPVVGFTHQIRPSGFSDSDSRLQPLLRIKAPQLHHSYVGSVAAAVSASTAIKGIPVSAPPKVASSPSSVSDCNGYKDLRDQDAIAIVGDRKVRITDGASLYALCRSWLRNGCPEESKPQFGNGVKSLPRPLSTPVAVAQLLRKTEHNEEEEEEAKEGEDEESVDNLSAQDLLQRHVMHARRIRARLREERLWRIARYKTRLGCLLHPQVDQL